MRKSIRDQIIEGMLDGDSVEELLRERDLSLDTAISKCRAQEAAKKQRAQIADGTQVQTIRHQPARQQDRSKGRPQISCPGCGAPPHSGGRQHCPAFNRVCHKCRTVGHLARVCRSRRQSPRPPAYNNPGAMAVQLESSQDEPPPEVNSSSVEGDFEPAPTIQLHVESLNGSSTITVLPDSGADVSVAGLAVLDKLNEHPDNLLQSDVTPRAVNGSRMSPVGKLPVTFSLGATEYRDVFHIYPQVRGALLSWKAARGLRILPECYPHPSLATTLPSIAKVSHESHSSSDSDVMAAFPSVFDGQVKTMEGENFRIELAKNARPFCVHTPRSVPFAYCEKLRAELDLLQAQGTVPTEWCAPIVVTPKKNTEALC